MMNHIDIIRNEMITYDILMYTSTIIRCYNLHIIMDEAIYQIWNADFKIIKNISSYKRTLAMKLLVERKSVLLYV